MIPDVSLSPILDSRGCLREELNAISTYIMKANPLSFLLMGDKMNFFRVLVFSPSYDFRMFIRTVACNATAKLGYQLDILPDTQFLVNPTPNDLHPPCSFIKVVVWNCVGFKRMENFVALGQLCSVQNPDILVLTDTRCSLAEASQMVELMNFDGQVEAPVVDGKGGMWILCRSSNLVIPRAESGGQQLHASVKVIQ